MTKLITRRVPTVFGSGFFNSALLNSVPDWFARPILFEDPDNRSDFPQVSFPRVDVRETDKELRLVVEIPGMKKDDIQVTVHDGTLTISGERKTESEETQDGVLRREISQGAFKRSFTLPDTLDVDKIDANYQDGLLNIAFPKLEKAKPKQIEIKVR